MIDLRPTTTIALALDVNGGQVDLTLAGSAALVLRAASSGKMDLLPSNMEIQGKMVPFVQNSGSLISEDW